MSKLHVEISKIDRIEDLENADKLQMATIKGWNCLVGKDQHKVGDLVIFVPPDAIIPEDLIEKLQLDYLKGNGRVKTVKLRGYVSQGLVLPTEIVPANIVKEGQDVAKVLGITKYEPPTVKAPKKKDTFFNLWNKFIRREVTLRRFIFKTIGLIKDYFKPRKKANPNFDTYTDLDNIKYYLNVFEEGEEVVITEKIHGTNFRAGRLPLKETVIGRIKSLFTRKTHEFVYGSRRVQKTPFSGKGYYGEDVYGQIADRYNLSEVIPDDYIIYGEIYGHKIQELTYRLKDSIDVVFFDVKYKGKYLDWDDFVKFCEERNLPIVPVLFRGKYHYQTLKAYTEGWTVLGDGKHIREGVVLRPVKEEYSNRCGRKILKSISAEYLLTKKEDKPDESIDENAEYPH